jgi:hypothetical protein
MYKVKLLHVLLFSLLVLGVSTCTLPDSTPNLELGLYEYAGIDNKTFHFYRKEANGQYREVIPKTTGIGILRPEYFCDEDFCGRSFYGCGLYPNLPKPYFDFKPTRVITSIFFAPEENIATYSVNFKVQGDSLFLNDKNGSHKVLKPTGPKVYEFSILWRISANSRAFGFYYELINKSLTDQEHLIDLETMRKANVGDTIALCLLKERFIKQ